MILYTGTLAPHHTGLNLAWEDFFLRSQKENGRMFLVFYENFSSMVLGKSLEIEKEIFTDKRHPPVYRRISGGGSVFHSKGNLNYSLFLSLADFPELNNVTVSYQKILTALAVSLGRHVAMQGLSDLALFSRGAWRKFSGNAQCRKQGWIMHHGTLLYSKKIIPRISYYLKPPPKEPEYRLGRNHRTFMTTVLPCYSRATLMHRVRLSFAEAFDATLCKINFTDTNRITPFQAETLSQ